MATVHYDTACRDGFDDAEDGLGNPFAVADSEHSDVVRGSRCATSPVVSDWRCLWCGDRNSPTATCGSPI